MSGGLIGVLQQKGIWRGFERQVAGLEPILVEMSKRGMPVRPVCSACERGDGSKCEGCYQGAMDIIVADIERTAIEMQALVPDEIKAKQTYKREPRKRTAAHFSVDGKWFRYKKWSPSNKGLVAYMRFRGHPVPKDLKTDKDTTKAMEIIRLYRKTGDALYAKVIGYRKAQHVLTDHMANWKPGLDAHVHSTFYFDPATGQLSSRRPNTQNAPHHDDPEFGGYADVFRGMIAAPPGHLILEFDFKSFHVQTLAFNAEDADMLRLAKLDIHSFVTAHFLKLGDASRMIARPDDELRDYLAWIKRTHRHTRDAQVKHALLGYNNGMGYKKLFKQYMEFFANEGEAKRVLQLLDGLFPKAKAYRDRICAVAHEQGYLISRHGYIRYFWEVNRWQGGKWSHGDDHEAALCYYTQNDAHGEIRERMIVLSQAGLDAKYNFCNTIHDSLMFVWPEKELDKIATVKGIMELPSKVLVNSICPNGLSVEVEVKGGPTWASMKGIA